MKRVGLLVCILFPVFSVNAQLSLKIDKVLSPINLDIKRKPLAKEVKPSEPNELAERERMLAAKEMELKHKMEDYYENNQSVKKNLSDLSKIQLMLKEQESSNTKLSQYNNKVHENQLLKEKELATLEKNLKEREAKLKLLEKSSVVKK